MPEAVGRIFGIPVRINYAELALKPRELPSQFLNVFQAAGVIGENQARSDGPTTDAAVLAHQFPDAPDGEVSHTEPPSDLLKSDPAEPSNAEIGAAVPFDEPGDIQNLLLTDAELVFYGTAVLPHETPLDGFSVSDQFFTKFVR